MNSPVTRPPAHLTGAIICTGLVLIAFGVSAGGPLMAQFQAVPSDNYFTAVEELRDGDYKRGEREFSRELRTAIKTPQSHWIDSICYHTMLGECYYHAGNYPDALGQYNRALKLYLAFSDWLVRVQFRQPKPAPSLARKRVPWGRSTRAFTLADVPDTMLTTQGQINNNQVVRRGGVVRQAIQFPIDAQEIVRCTALALRRRRDLMGPVAKYDRLTNDLVNAFSRRPAPPNHWSQAWIDLQLGLAHAAAENAVLAQKYLQQSLMLTGQFDHPLTSVAMLELGRMAMEAGNLTAAAKWCEEASYSAYYYENIDVLEDALRNGLHVHLMANRPGIYPPLLPRDRLVRRNRQYHVQLALLGAENQISLDQPQAAKAELLLKEAIATNGRRQILAGRLGARHNFVSAMVRYQQDRSQLAWQHLNTAMKRQRTASKWLFQIGLTDARYVNQALVPRNAMVLYGTLLRDPSAADWSQDPMEAMGVLANAHHGSYENWFTIALKRGVDTAVEIADRARRHRFFTSLPMGGRLLSLRGILETPPDALDNVQALQRQDLLVHYPNYDALSQQSQGIRTHLRGQPVTPHEPDDKRSQAQSLEELATISRSQERILRAMALRREPANMIYPPVLPTREVQSRLKEGQALVVFFATSRYLHGFVLGSEAYRHWRIRKVDALRSGISELLRDMGNTSVNREVNNAVITGDQWKESSRKAYNHLFGDSRMDINRVQQLIVVPDSFLWYLPFEVLIAGGQDANEPLIERAQIRYVPTAGLAVTPSRTPQRAINTGVVVGKLFPQDGPTVSTAAFERLSAVVPSASPIEPDTTTLAPVFSVLLDGLVVLDDIDVHPDRPYAWSPWAGRKKTHDFMDWFSLPWGGPHQIILPGFHTAAESGFKRKRGRTPSGHEVFLTVTGLMAEGGNTILMSRWRTGGQTCFDLVREFAQELPHVSASEAWQRSVLLAMDQPLDPDLEPRIHRFSADDAPTAAHPFLWAPYLLVASPLPTKQVVPPEREPVLNFKAAGANAKGEL